VCEGDPLAADLHRDPALARSGLISFVVIFLLFFVSILAVSCLTVIDLLSCGSLAACLDTHAWVRVTGILQLYIILENHNLLRQLLSVNPFLVP